MSHDEGSGGESSKTCSLVATRYSRKSFAPPGATPSLPLTPEVTHNTLRNFTSLLKRAASSPPRTRGTNTHDNTHGCATGGGETEKLGSVSHLLSCNSIGLGLVHGLALVSKSVGLGLAYGSALLVYERYLVIG